ncbi:unnamed protein product, partial [Mesorhabditis spiculigera]
MRLLWVFSFLLLLGTATSLNLLLFLIGTNQFERGTFEYLAQQLALRHHNVITVKPILIPEEPRLVKPKLHLVREKTMKNLLTKKLYEPLEKIGDTVPWSQNYELDKMEEPYWVGHNASCVKMLNSNLMDQLKKDELDVVIAYAGNPCQLALVHVIGKPVIYFDQEGLTDETLVAAGASPSLDYPSSHCSFRPTPLLPLNRIFNGICILKEYLAQSRIPFLASIVSRRYKHLDQEITRMFAEDYEIKKRFKPFPDVNELKGKSALFFANTDRLLEYERPLPPHVIPVGGMHIDHPKPLFAPWNTSIESAESGMIIVSMGTQANSANMPEYMARALFGALSKLKKYRIYWRVGPTIKLAGVDVEKPPSHINFTAYIPQNDLLAHKSCKLLITNGGMLSIMEAVAHGVPMVGIPLYGQNRHNMGKVAHRGLGVVVEKQEVSESTIYAAIKNVLDYPSFKNKAKWASKEFKARKNTPFEEVLHWIEFIAQQQGNPLKSPAVHPLIQLARHLCLDLILAVFFVLYVPYAFAKWYLRRMLNRTTSTHQKSIPSKSSLSKDSNNNGSESKKLK